MITLCLCVSLIWKSYAHFQWDCNWNGQTQFQLLQQINCDKIVINLPIGLHAHFSKHLPIYVFNYTRNQIETLSASFRSGIHIDWIFHHKSSARKKATTATSTNINYMESYRENQPDACNLIHFTILPLRVDKNLHKIQMILQSYLSM